MGVIEFPKVPQTVKIYSKVNPGTRFIFVGTCGKKNFSFALISSTHIALLLEFEMEKDRMVKAKSYMDGVWSTEVIAKNPVRQDSIFFIQIMTSDERFEVFCDGRLLFSMKHRVPIDTITGIRLMETMELQKIEMEQR